MYSNAIYSTFFLKAFLRKKIEIQHFESYCITALLHYCQKKAPPKYCQLFLANFFELNFKPRNGKLVIISEGA